MYAMRDAAGGGGPPLSKLAARAAGGEAEAVRALLRAVAPSMLRACRGVLGSSSGEAEEALQESLTALLSALPAFRGESPIRHYATTIAVRVAMKLRRKGERARRREDAVADGLAVVRSEPDARLHEQRCAECLRDLLEELPAEQAEALVMRVVLDHTPAEIAAATGAPVNTVRSRVRLAKSRLLDLIESDHRARELLGAPP